MEEIQLILSVLGILYLVTIIRKIWFHGDYWDKYEEEKEKRQFPTFGS